MKSLKAFAKHVEIKVADYIEKMFKL